MLVLGLIDSKPSAAALLDGGRLLAAVAEERLCRMKMASGIPRGAIEQVLKLAGASPGDVERVALAQWVCPFVPEPQPWSGWFEDEHAWSPVFTRLGSTLAPLLSRLPLALYAHQRLKRLMVRGRLAAVPTLLRDAYGLTAPVSYHDHHGCHATSAYYTCDLEPALVVTLDGGGDGLSGSVWEGRGGRLRRLATVPSFHSLGNFYSYVTEVCGFRAEKHEGKVTGLAALGEPLYADALRRFIAYREPGQIRYRVPMYHRSALQRLRAALPRDFDRAHLAASVQLLLEEICIDFVRHWLRRTGLRNLALAGGVFANVKLNQRLHQLDEVERLFIHPAMDDSGLSVGGALAALAEPRHGDPSRLKARLPSVFLGPEPGDAEIESAIAAAGLLPRRQPDIHAVIAERLARGYVVSRCTGRMEYGPRALGHRSILYQTTEPTVNDWLNERLDRTEFMPFGPATLMEEAHRCYEAVDGARDPARFMTITFDCTAEMRRTSPGVVHADGTARPQLVDAETAPDFHKILTAYHRRTGIPSLINTSFNLHEEPIVCTPEDALRSFQQGHLDYLAIGDYLLEHPEGAARHGVSAPE